MKDTKIITSECVSYGHPDKVADQISDALLDAYLGVDSNTRAGIEVMIKDNIIILGGEVKTNAKIDVENVARSIVESINYPESHNLKGENLKIVNLIGEQSKEISRGVDNLDCDCIGAGDQGFVVGMASNETEDYLPLGVYVARQICNGVCKLDGFGPDVKTQVCVDYEGVIPKIVSIVVSSMHSEKIRLKTVQDKIINLIRTNNVNGSEVMDSIIFLKYIKGKEGDCAYYINVNGEWNIGGPIADCGLTGRKIVVDQYGGYCNVGGGAFSGKDMSKVDRSGAYMCRYIAKNIVGSGLARFAKVELSYVISKPEPCSINIELNGEKNNGVNGYIVEKIKEFINKRIDLTPSGIIHRFFPNGIRPIFYNTARNGHYGFNGDNDFYPWEKIDFSSELRECINK